MERINTATRVKLGKFLIVCLASIIVMKCFKEL